MSSLSGYKFNRARASQMKRPSIKTSLVTIFAIFAMLFGATAYCALEGIGVLNDSTSNFSSNILPSISAAKDIQLGRYKLRSAFQTHMTSSSADDMKAAEKDITTQEQALQDAVDAYAKYVSSDHEREVQKSLTPLIQEYKEKGLKVIALSSAGEKQDAMEVYNDIITPIGKKISSQAEELININANDGVSATTASAAAYSNTLFIIYTVLGVSVVVIIGSAWFGLSGIASPVKGITSAMTLLAGGDTAAAIPYAGRSDEIGGMAAAVEVFRQAAIANKRLELEADANRQKSEADRVRLTAEAEAAAQQRLQQATSGLAAGLKRLAAGDLSFELKDAFAPDFEALRHDLNGAVAQLGQTLRSVAQSTSSIDSGSREISRSADDLSRRTEQQAASLEETAAALDQITVNVSNSSKRADEARAVAIQANSSAAESGTVVANAVNAMQRIEASSTQISNIIGVIDEIAFQTNLLALNAGVEAARAGEAGRGFAVVAQEVRELAQRSAKAAKEIKGLISTSTAEVESGVKLVRATGDALKTIEQYIVTINQHMDSIATSAREQSTGLGEVNTAVNQMDQVTQQNAAMVEETNAAGSTLATEAGNLRELISQFNLGGGASRTANVSALRQTASAMASPAYTQQRSAVAPARKMVANGGGAAAKDSWEEF
jgi:methyl-accepting chemotaxis protein